MSLSVVIGYAGVLVAAAASVMLVSWWIRRPRPDFIVWTAATLALTAALVAQSRGFASGFGEITFRVVQIGAQVLAPLWIAWGLIELVWDTEAIQFASRLLAGALTAVASVIVVTDPLTSQTFGKTWPSASYLQSVSHDALDVVQAAAVLAALAGVLFAAAGAVRRSPACPPLTSVVPAALAVFATVAMRLPLPDRAIYPLLCAVAAALLAGAAARARGWTRPVSQEAGDADEYPSQDNSVLPGDGDRSADGYEPYDDDHVAYGGAMAGGDQAEDGDQAENGDVADGQYELYGQRGPLDPAGQPSTWDRGAPDPGAQDFGTQGFGTQGFGAPDRGTRGFGAPDPDGPYLGEPLLGARDAGDPGHYGGPGHYGDPGRSSGPGHYGAPGHDGDPDFGAWDEQAYLADPVLDGLLAAAGLMTGADTGGAGGRGASRPYGRILIFTLLDDRVEDFDRLAEQAAEQVSISEPDTLVYVIHLVPNAPLQRIFYEIYRDRAAFDHHENQSYMQRFVAERRSCVLATNVIELRLKYAKVAPLPGAQAAIAPPAQASSQAPVQPAAQPGTAPAGNPVPAGASARASGPLPRLQPLPPDPYLNPQGPRVPQGGQRFQPPQPARAQYQAPSPYQDQPSYQNQPSYQDPSYQDGSQYGTGPYAAQPQYPGGQPGYPGSQAPYPGDQARTDPRSANPWRAPQHRPDQLRPDPQWGDQPRQDQPRQDPRQDPLRQDLPPGDPRWADARRAGPPQDDWRRGDPQAGDPRWTDSWRAGSPQEDPRWGDPLAGDPRRADSWRADPPAEDWRGDDYRPGDRRTGEWRTDETWSPGPQRPDQPRPGHRRAPSAGRPGGGG